MRKMKSLSGHKIKTRQQHSANLVQFVQGALPENGSVN